jgi:tetratricopeptide (TPR) repeat protein
LSLAIQRAVQCHAEGRYAEAEILYTAILAGEPTHFDALHMSGVLRYQQGRNTEARDRIAAALAVNPNASAAWSNIGLVYADLHQPEQALACYNKAITLSPDQPDVFNNRGIALVALGRLADALASYDRAIAIRPDFAEALHNRGTVLNALKRLDDALASFDTALAIRPDYHEAEFGRGQVLEALGRAAEALASFDRTLARRPDHVQALCHRGNVLMTLQRPAEALKSYDRALAREPRSAEALNNRGNALFELGDPQAALASYERAIVARPHYAEALNNRGNVLMDLGRYEETLASYDRAIALRPGYAEAFGNRALAHVDLGHVGEAMADYDTALALDPQNARVHLGRAQCLLLQGDLERGWREHEWRRQLGPALAPRAFTQPLWLGDSDLEGKTILLHSEQGFGDTIQFCRFARQLLQQAATVLLHVPSQLKTLVETLDPALRLIATGGPLPDFDCHCPLLSLPLALGTTLTTIPAEAAYLSAPVDRIALWRHRLGARTKPRVGLVWAGSPRKGMPYANKMDRQRSIAFDRLAPLLERTDCVFYSLQKGNGAIAGLRDSPYGHHVIDWTDALHDFADTAALVSNLDLVISVDTAVAHLAGSLGKPLWLLNRFNTCWRWLRDRRDSPWYPTARIFRQPAPGDWTSVIEDVLSELHVALPPA